ncbi:MAG: ATP-binding cassette domain-containing protein [Clostridiales bacterium]|nr:ATP-binding cassette domain-containing protein [Clostridiales bacterium]
MDTDEISIEALNLRKTFKIRKRDGGFTFIKRYSQIEAVRDISFSIQKGDIVGFIGPNGAGKSTTVKMLTGILMPDDGSIRINGMDYRKNRRDIMKKIGVVFGQRSVLCWDIPVIESFRLFKDMYCISNEMYNKNMNMFSDILNLKEYMHQPPRLLSLGQRMKADLAAALLYNPEILFLDEPTIGIDILAKERIRDFIKQINQECHTTVVLTTHDVSDIEVLCHKMLVIDHGNLIYDGTLSEMKENYATQCSDSLNKEDVELEHIIKQIYKGSFL